MTSRTIEESNKHIINLERRIKDLENTLEYEEKCGRALDGYKGKDIREIRKKYPSETSLYLDTEIAVAYSVYSQENHAGGWCPINVDDFVVWAFKGAINCYT